MHCGLASVLIIEIIIPKLDQHAPCFAISEKAISGKDYENTQNTTDNLTCIYIQHQKLKNSAALRMSKWRENFRHTPAI